MKRSALIARKQWSPTSYVCQSCIRRLAAIESGSYNRTQRRHDSTKSYSAAHPPDNIAIAEDEDDDYISNFNAISKSSNQPRELSHKEKRRSRGKVASVKKDGGFSRREMAKLHRDLEDVVRSRKNLDEGRAGETDGDGLVKASQEMFRIVEMISGELGFSSKVAGMKKKGEAKPEIETGKLTERLESEPAASGSGNEAADGAPPLGSVRANVNEPPERRAHPFGNRPFATEPGVSSLRFTPAKQDGSTQLDASSAEDQKNTVLKTRFDSVAASPQRKTLRARVADTNSRPQWGGRGLQTSLTRQSTKLKFNSLRNFDKVSPKQEIKTAGQKVAWGSEPANEGAGREGVAESEDASAKRAQKEDAEDGVGQSFLNGLKNIIGVRLSDGISTEAAEEEKKADDADAMLGHQHLSNQNAHENAEERYAEQPRVKLSRKESQALRRERREEKRAAAALAKSQAEEITTLTGSRDGVQQASDGDESSTSVELVSNDIATEASSDRVSESQSHDASFNIDDIKTLSSDNLQVTPLDIPKPAIANLQHGLDRVLFSPGVHQLQDPYSRVYNFDPYLQTVTPISEFDFNALQEYKTSSADMTLGRLANDYGKKFVGSTSSMTSVLAHFHYLLSNWRPLNTSMLSKGFPEKAETFTQINRAPTAIFLRYRKETGTYAIDADKEFDGANVLMILGKSMEKFLTLPKEEYARYRRGNNVDPITAEEKAMPEAFEYTTQGNLLMRSQLDAYDPRLPGTGTFDLKTRAVVSIRMDTSNFEEMLGYELLTLQGAWESYEKEYYDMMRSTMLKYMLQARMGRMEGIFVAYHNIERVFGFQYLSMQEMDRALHGDVGGVLGEREFRFSLGLLDEVLEMASGQFAERDLRMHFETAEGGNHMWVFAEPVKAEEIQAIQSKSKAKVEEFERRVMGIEKEDVVEEEVVEKEDGQSEGVFESIQAVDSAAEARVPVTEDAAPGATSSAGATSLSTSSTSGRPDPSNIAADTPLLDTFAIESQTSEASLRPLFAATLIVQNFVNGVPCDNNRPTRLKPDDTWEVQYILKEANIPLSEKWARYEDCKTRRRTIYQRVSGEEADGDETEGVANAKQERREGYYMRVLREMARKGRERRAGREGREKGEQQVFAFPVVKTGAKQEDRTQQALKRLPEVGVEELKNVESYISWLYGAK